MKAKYQIYLAIFSLFFIIYILLLLVADLIVILPIFIWRIFWIEWEYFYLIKDLDLI